MATKAELEKQLAEAQAALANVKRPDVKKININTAQKILGIKLVGLGGTKDKKIQAIQADIINLTIALAELASGGKFEAAVAAPKQVS
jgi:hypothetical protein